MAAMTSPSPSMPDMTQMWEESVDDLLARKLLSRGLNRGEFSRRFDKDGLSKCHMVAAREYQRMVEQGLAASNVFHVMEMERDGTPLESLQKCLDISGLDPRVIDCEQGKTFAVHSRLALYGRLCVPAFKTGGVCTVLEDSSGKAVPVVIHHAAAASDFPVGMRVAIKQPCFATLTRSDRCVGVVVDNPACLVNLDGPRVVADPGSTFGCSEFIGPVEIGLGKDEHNTGRRGLFASRDVKHGDFLLRTRPLTMGRKRKEQSMLGVITHGSRVDASTPFPERLLPSTMQEMIVNMLKAAERHPRSAHMLYSLALADSPTKAIPPMALFDPSVKGKYDPLALDIGRIRRTIATNVAGTGASGDAEASAVWALPSFMNHDCEPSCGVSYDGDDGEVQIVRAHGNMPAGGELTLGYWDVGRTWHYRQRKSRALHFACSCRRCLFEERLAKSTPRFKQLSKLWHDVNEAHLLSPAGDPSSSSKGAAQASPSLLKDEVENMLLRTRMTPQQKEWIRKSFSQQSGARAYCSSSSKKARWQGPPKSSLLSSSVSYGAGFHVHQNSMLCAFLPRKLSMWRPVLKLLP